MKDVARASQRQTDEAVARQLRELPRVMPTPERARRIQQAGEAVLRAGYLRDQRWQGWRSWYENALEPLLLASACAVYLGWAVRTVAGLQHLA